MFVLIYFSLAAGLILFISFKNYNVIRLSVLYFSILIIIIFFRNSASPPLEEPGGDPPFLAEMGS